MMIAEEGIFSFRRNKKVSEPKQKFYPTFTIQKASKNDLIRLYNTEAFCAEGLRIDPPDPQEVGEYITSCIVEWEDYPHEIHYYYCRGKDLNTQYHLTGDNKYPDNLSIFFIDYSNFGRNFDISGFKGNFRYFSDIVDNNAAREIRKGNKYYDNYQSIYGQEWMDKLLNL